jgi:saccharopine dehydrogenase-like NADP-dependent oxidoreductase
VTTAAGITGVVDMVRSGELKQAGFLKMEEIDCAKFLRNRFGKYYA